MVVDSDQDLCCTRSGACDICGHLFLATGAMMVMTVTMMLMMAMVMMMAGVL